MNTVALLLCLCVLFFSTFIPLHSNMVARAANGLEIIVTTTSDTVDGDVSSFEALIDDPGADGAISLREALLATNATPAGVPLVICFEIPTTDAGYQPADGTWRIRPFNLALPSLVRGHVTIDGTTQSGYAGTPRIILDGYDVYVPDNLLFGVHITSANNTIHALTIVNFWDAAVVIEGPQATNNRVIGSQLGIDHDRQVEFPGYSGVELRNGASGNQIGSEDPLDRNLIGGHRGYGVLITGATSGGNQIAGNWIGVADNGTSADANGVAGIEINGAATGNMIGGVGRGNVIAGNPIGIKIIATRQTNISGNLIGLRPDGLIPLPNTDGGIFLFEGADETRIGGTLPAERNVIAGNGVFPTPYGQGIYIATGRQNRILGNYIGVTRSGMLPAGNLGAGILILGDSRWNEIGDTPAGSGNLIAYNGGGGIVIDHLARENRIAGNQIGIAADGITSLGNQRHGVQINGSENTVGPANLIANNQWSGIAIGGSHVLVNENQIMRNTISGICITAADVIVRDNTIGQNGLSGASGSGCSLRGGVVVYDTDRALIQANTIVQNRNAGVTIARGRINRILANSITNNQIGIRLLDGGNDMLPPPTLTEISSTRISGYACPYCHVEIFADGAAEGHTLLGTTIAAATGEFSKTIPGESFDGMNITTTATDQPGNTSSFGQAQSSLQAITRLLYLPLIGR